MTEPKQLSKNQRSGPDEKIDIITIYVCPTKGCGNYFGSSHPSFQDLEKQKIRAPITAKDAGQVRGTRAKCPTCGAERKLRYARLIPQDEVDEARKRLNN